VVVGTPVGVKNWINRRHIDRSKVRILAVDEADMMLSETNRPPGGGYGGAPGGGYGGGTQDNSSATADVRRMLPRTCQVVLFSATYPDRLTPFINSVLGENNYVKIVPK